MNVKKRKRVKVSVKRIRRRMIKTGRRDAIGYELSKAEADLDEEFKE